MENFKNTPEIIPNEVIQKAVRGDRQAMAEIKTYLRNWANEHGKSHAEIEALRIAIYTIAGNTDCQVKAFRAQLMKIIEEVA